MPTLDQIKIVDRLVYYIADTHLSEFHEEVGWYCDIVYYDGEVDTYGPFDSKEDATVINGT